MAYLLADGNDRAYLVERSVGFMSYNEKEDVKLVQYMLSRIYSSSLPVNGTPSAQLNNKIYQFQRDMVLRGEKVRLDGRVDSPEPSAARRVFLTGRLSKTTYTMILLNFALIDKDPAAYENIPHVVKLNPKPTPYAYSSDISYQQRQTLG